MPDTQGFGVSRFAGDAPTAEQTSPRNYARAVLEWIRLLGLEDAPLVLVGHSMSAVALMSLTREELPPGAARVCLTPLANTFDPTMSRRLGIASAVVSALRALGLSGVVRAIMRRRVARGRFSKHLTLAMHAEIAKEVERTSVVRLQRIIDGVRSSRPAIPLARCTLVIGAGDPAVRIPREHIPQASETLGLRRENVRYFASGHHYPHLENRDHPELAEANRAQIVRIVDDALAASEEHRERSAAQRTATEVRTSGATEKREPTTV
jgi:pimeloyl-ACP methyl ester carboxylesterase